MQRSYLQRNGVMTLMTYPLLFHKIDECGPFNFNWVTIVVVEGKNKVEEIALPQIIRWLLLKPRRLNFNVRATLGASINSEIL